MLTATTFLVLVTVILQGAFMQPVMECLGFGSADGEKDENGSPNRNNNNIIYKEIGGGGDDEDDDDDIPNVESLHPSSGKNNKAVEPMRHRSSSYHALEKFDAKYIQPWLMSEPPPSPNRMLNGGKSSSHPNTPSRLRKGGKSSIATAQRNLSASDFSGRTKNDYNAESGERKPLLGEQTSKKSFSSSRTRGSTRGPLVFDAFGQHDREASLASSVIEDSLRLPEYEREKEGG